MGTTGLGPAAVASYPQPVAVVETWLKEVRDHLALVSHRLGDALMTPSY